MMSSQKIPRSGGRSSIPASSDRPEDTWLPVGKLITFGFQHVLTMYGGIIAVPLVVANAMHLSPGRSAIMVTASLFVGGLATILQSVGVPFFGAKLPVVQGVTFGGVATMLAILATPGSDITTVLGAVIVASIIGLLIAPFFASVVRFLPPVVTGTVIAGIGLSLVPVASDWAMGGDAEAGDYGSMPHVILAFVTLAITLFFSKIGSAALSRLSILLGLVLGTVVGIFMGLTDFSDVGDGAWAALPEFFGFGWPTFDPAAIVSMVIVILVAMTESVANLLAVGEVVGSRVGRRRISRGLRADMLSSAVAPVFGSFTQTAFSQNIGLIALTGVRSRFVVATGGVILVIMGLLPVLGQVVAAIPMPVLGGAGMVLFGTVAGSGIRTLKSVSFEGNMNLVIVSVSLAFGMVPVVQPDIYEGFPSWFQTIFTSGISSTAFMAVLLNLVFNEIHLGNPKGASVFAARPVRYMTSSDLQKLQEGDVVTDGKLLDRDGEEVPTVPDSRTEEIRQAIDSGEVTDTSEIRLILDGTKKTPADRPGN